MNRKFFIWMAFGTASLIAAMAFTLWHDSQISLAHNNWQLSRVDFEHPLTPEEALVAKQSIREFAYVKHLYFNPDSDALVIAHVQGSFRAEAGLRQLNQRIEKRASLYQVSEARLQSGCPITGERGTWTLTKAFFKNLF